VKSSKTEENILRNKLSDATMFGSLKKRSSKQNFMNETSAHFSLTPLQSACLTKAETTR